MSNKELWEGFVSAAQRKAVWASKADGGKGHPDNKKKKSKKEDVNPKVGLKVMKKGKEVEPTPPKIGVVSYTRGKKDVNEISKDMAGRYLKKVPASSADAGRKSTGTTGIGSDDQKKNMKKGINQFVNRQRGTSMAVDKMTGKAKVPATESVEETVNELDTSTLISYRKKANKQRYSNNISKRPQRTDGVDRADKKLRARNIDKFGNNSPKGVDKMGNPKEDSDAVKAFLAKGGKIKKLPPAKAQGYHGKDDPGKDMHGVMDKPDTSKFKTRKKVKSMENKVHEDPEMAKMIAKNNAAQQAKRDAANPDAAKKRKAAQDAIAKKKPVTPDSIGRHSSQGGGFVGTRESTLKTFDDLRSQLSESKLEK